jgi:hypothetical protein
MVFTRLPLTVTAWRGALAGCATAVDHRPQPQKTIPVAAPIAPFRNSLRVFMIFPPRAETLLLCRVIRLPLFPKPGAIHSNFLDCSEAPV